MCKNNKFDLQAFKEPPSEYRPVIFWSWNETMESDELSRQLKLMKESGLGGGFIHSRIGLLTEYLGEDWFKAVDTVVEESRKSGLKVYLYDEDKWPSGFAGGRVPLQNEQFRLKALLARSEGEKQPDSTVKIGKPANGLQIYKWTAPLGQAWFNGTCYSDLMSREAMEFFIKESYESYYKRYGNLYGSEILYEFTDEPCSIFRKMLPEGAIPFTDKLTQKFTEINGYDPSEYLYKLFMNCKGSEEFRLHYFRIINYLFENNFSKQIGQWCRLHDIDLTGHYMMEGSIYGQQAWGIKIMPNYRHQQVPGIDHLARQIDEIITAKQCQSIVNQYDKPRMLSELYGASGQSLSFEDRLWIATQQIQLGVNLLNPHLGLYTMAGCRKRDFPPNLFYQQPWWKVNTQLDIPLSRLCYAMSRGEYNADILVIHPQESACTLWQSKYKGCKNLVDSDWYPTTDGSYEKINEIESSIKRLLLDLLNNQLSFDLGDETVISEDSSVSESEGGTSLKIGNMKYTTVVIPQMHTISESTVKVLEKFKKAGGKVIAYKNTPELMDGRKSENLREFLSTVPNTSVENIVEELKSSENTVKIERKSGPTSHIWTHLRKISDNKVILLISNLNRERTFEGDLRVAGGWQNVELMDHFQGNNNPVDFSLEENAVNIPLTLAPVQSRLLLLETSQKQTNRINLTESEIREEIPLKEENFKIERLDENALTLDTAVWAEGDSDFSNQDIPVTAIQKRLNDIKYTGKLSLKYTFEVKDLKPDRKTSVVLEHPERYHIYLNGEEIHYQGDEYWLDIRFMPVDVTGKIKEGVNEILLVCDEFQYGDQTKVDDYFGRYGTEIESIYIKGDFSVEGDFSDINSKQDLKLLKKDSSVITEPGKYQLNNVVESGLPFYAGRLAYKVKLPELVLTDEQRLSINFEKLNAACAKIDIDGKEAGFIFSHPLSFDITDYYQKGALLEITLYSTLRNLLGPHHNKNLKVSFTRPEDFTPDFTPDFNTDYSYSKSVKLWDKEKIQAEGWSVNYFLFNFGSLGQISLKTFHYRPKGCSCTR